MSYWKDKRVMVTGGEGFLGSHVVERLHLSDCRRVVVVRHRDFDLSREEDVQRLFEEHRVRRAAAPGRPGRWHRRQQGEAGRLLPPEPVDERVDLAPRLAGRRREGGGDRRGLRLSGARAAAAAGDQLLGRVPAVESAPYSLAKRMLHVQSMAYWDQHRFPVIVTIPGNIYGPYDNFDLENAHVIPSLIRKFVTAVDQDQDRLAVWGSGARRATSSTPGTWPRASCGPSRSTTDPSWSTSPRASETSIRDVVDALSEISGFRGQVAWDAKPARWPVSPRLRRLPGPCRHGLGRARTSLRAGLARTMQWYREHRATARNHCPVSSREHVYA